MTHIISAANRVGPNIHIKVTKRAMISRVFELKKSSSRKESIPIKPTYTRKVNKNDPTIASMICATDGFLYGMVVNFLLLMHIIVHAVSRKTIY